MKLFNLLLLSLFLVGSAAAQSDTDYVAKPLVIEDVTKAMSRGSQPGFKIDVHGAKKKGTVDALTKAMKEENKAKLEVVNNEYIVRGVIFKSISPKPMTVYGIVNDHDNHVELLFFYEADSVFLSKEKNETEYLSARKFTRDFAVRAYKAAVQERIDAENKKLKDLESQLDQLYKEQDKLQKNISSENQKIDNSKEKIATSELDQDRVKKQSQDQKGKLAETKSGGNEVLIKEEEKKLKGFENEVSKLQKQEDGYHKDITNSEANIREYERNISDNETTAKMKLEDVAKQKDVINKLQKKLESIK